MVKEKRAAREKKENSGPEKKERRFAPKEIREIARIDKRRWQDRTKYEKKKRKEEEELQKKEEQRRQEDKEDEKKLEDAVLASQISSQTFESASFSPAVEMHQEVNSFNEDIPQTAAPIREFMAPSMGAASETRLEETAANAPMSVTSSPIENQAYSSASQRSYSSQQYNSSLQSGSQYGSRAASGYTSSQGRRERRFDTRDGLIADSENISPVPLVTDDFAREGDRMNSPREQLERFDGDQIKYKEKIELDTRRRKLMR